MNKLRGLIDRKLAKFLLVGVINTLIGTVIMFGLYNFAHCTYWVSSAVSYFLTSILSFFLNKYFTFGSWEKSTGEVVRFTINIAVCYLLAYGIAKPLCGAVLVSMPTTVRDNISMFVGMCLFTGLNYMGQRLFAFCVK